MIDLHLHTNFSDGVDSIETVLKKAEEKRLEVISITDHNTVEGYYALEKLNVKDYFNGKIICGIEMNTKAAGIPIEILGYNIDYKIMKRLLEKNYLKPEEVNKIEFKRLVEKCRQAGFVLDDDVEEQFNENTFASGVIHKNITNHAENRSKLNDRSWNSSRDFYRDYMSNPGTPLFVETSDLLPDFDIAIDIVKAANGLVFIPHIYEYRVNTPKVMEFILNNGRVDGFECYYTTFTAEQHDYLMKITEERHLLRSGGSDYHGSRKPDTDVGVGHGNLKIPFEIQKNWAKYLYE